jgi:hypothetical protein
LQESLRTDEVAKLCHRNAAKRERRRVVAQRDAVQCAKGITCGERTRCGRDQRVHLNPATVVTLAVRCRILVYPAINECVAGKRRKSNDKAQDRHTGRLAGGAA